MSDSRNLPPPRIDVPRNGTISNGSPTKPTMSDGKPNFLAPFLGAFAAVFIIALVAGGGYLGWSFFHSSAPKAKSPLLNVAQWQEGPVMSGALADPVKPDIGWWTRNFELPNLSPQVSEFLKEEGLNVSNIEPIHYKDNDNTTVLTYQVTVSVPGELLRVPQTTWTVPSNPDEARFIPILVLNKGLPPGTYWDTRNAKVEASANSQRTTLFNVRLDKASNVVTADRLLPTDLVTPQQVSEYQTETQNVIASLDQHIQQIDAQVKSDTQSQLAQVPSDPPKPKPQTAHFGGDGSGEPTKSAERIGGGAAAGAAGGALFGAAAGNAGMGAGIGAGVGLLGGIIYNAVSKSNDKEKLEAEVADQNQERLDNWRDQIKALKQQRAQIQSNAPKERASLLDNLANQITANQGYLAGTGETAPNSPAPTSDQPSGPMSSTSENAPDQRNPGNAAQLTADNAKDLDIKRRLLGYWRSPRHDYCYSANGTIYMMGDATTTNSWDIKNGLYYCDNMEYTIVSLTPDKFIFRSHDANPITFTETRITADQAGQSHN